MFREALTFSESVILAGCAGMVGCAAALAWHRGHRRAVVGIPVTFIAGAMAAPMVWMIEPGDGIVVGGVIVLSLLMMLLSLLAVPLLAFAGLFERDYLWRVRLGHAALVLAGWICGPVMMAWRGVAKFH